MMSQSDTALLVQLQWRLFNRRKISLILSTGVNGVRFVDMHISSVNVNASLVQSFQQRRSSSSTASLLMGIATNWAILI